MKSKAAKQNARLGISRFEQISDNPKIRRYVYAQLKINI